MTASQMKVVSKKLRREEATIEDVQEYWDTHLNLTQFITRNDVDIGSDEFYRLLGQALDRYEYKQTLLREFAKARSGSKLLEVGCGLGVELAQLGKLGFLVTGIDLSPQAIGVANTYLNTLGVRGEALVENAEDLSFDDETFDAVYSCGVLQHTPNIERAISEIWRVLKPGGDILIILYHRFSWFYLLQRLSGTNIEFESEEAPIINTYTRTELRTLFAQFRDIEIQCEYYYPRRTKRRGVLPFLYNYAFVPATRWVPRSVARRFGWHLVLKARK